MNWILLTVLSSQSSLARIGGSYEVGDTISEVDQQIALDTCFEGNDYVVGDTWSLADWNGALEGGTYSVIVVTMSATWCGPCYNSLVSDWAQLYKTWETKNTRVKFINALMDIGQPYTCDQWGNEPSGDDVSAQIVSDSNDFIFSLLGSEGGVPSYAFVAHDMTVHYKAIGSGAVSIDQTDDLINEMLALCGALCVSIAGDTNTDGTVNVQDVVLMVTHVMGTDLLTGNGFALADINSDGSVNIQDIVSVVNIIMGR
jgi:hypothetical protein